jgi:predicted DNA-binding protein
MSLVQSKPSAGAGGLVKSAGSLSSGMLARKGDARPGQRYMPEPGLEIPERSRMIKFGSDMLESLPPVVHAVDVIEPFTDAHDFPEYENDAPVDVIAPVTSLAEVPLPAAFSYATESVNEVEQEWIPPVRISLKGVRKSAFTLRLDAERHLRLRLLSAHQHRSAQQIVIEAVDRFLTDVFDPLMASGRLSRD